MKATASRTWPSRRTRINWPKLVEVGLEPAAAGRLPSPSSGGGAAIEAAPAADDELRLLSALCVVIGYFRIEWIVRKGTWQDAS